MFYNDDEIKRIKEASEGRLIDVVEKFQSLRRSGADYTCDCP